MQKIILASGSPRRKQLLQWAEVPFDVLVMETDESYPPGLSPRDIAIHIAKNKATKVKDKHGDGSPVLAADTIVVHGDEIMGKPAGRNDAIQMLSKLSGKKHLVITGVCILFNSQETVFADTTEVEFHELSDEQIAFYVDTYKPFDKAGAYAIQEWIGVTGIRSITGDFYNVMGLPISRVVKILQSLNP